MVRTALCELLILCSAMHWADASSKKRVAHKRTGGFLKTDTLRGDLQAAMAEALGQDHDVEFVQYDVIRHWLAPMFKALPQISANKGHVELRVMEHALHRYFMKRYGMSLRPFEPHRIITASELGATDILGDRAPAFVEEILRGRFNHNGFSLDDAVSMVATMEQFLYDDTLRRIRKAHDSLFPSGPVELTESQALQVIEQSIKQVQDEPEGEQSILAEDMDWATEEIVKGELQRIVYKRNRRVSRVALKVNSFTLDEVAHAAHAIVIAGSEYFSDCEGLRQHMASFDPQKTGRVALSDLYWNSEATGFEIRESKDWLKRLGALDESSTWKGPQVIIPNYVSSASNCVMTTSLYRVCCPNKECESLVSRIENEVGAPTGNPQQIMPVIMNMVVHDEDNGRDPVQTIMPLSKKLWEIAQHHGDKGPENNHMETEIPLNGRLFQQWLHYVKPQHCPYPHKRGTVEVVNLAGCGRDCALNDTRAEAADLETVHVPPEGSLPEGNSDEAWMSQWALEEELVIDETSPSPIHSDMARRMIAFAAALLLTIVGFICAFYCWWGLVVPILWPKSPRTGDTVKKAQLWDTPFSTKSHVV